MKYVLFNLQSSFDRHFSYYIEAMNVLTPWYGYCKTPVAVAADDELRRH